MSGLLGAIGDLGGAIKSAAIVVSCRSSQTLRVTVTDAVSGLAVSGATVVATENGGWTRTGYTDGNGLKEFVVYPGTYSVTAAKDWYLPEPRTSAGNVVNAGATVNVAMNIDQLRFYLFADNDRDGVVDNVTTDDPRWTWGAHGSGAIMLCNCDDDDVVPKNAADHSDNIVNGGNDNTELAPLDVVRIGSAQAPPNNWTAMLHLLPGEDAHVRLFDTRLAGGAELIPSNGNNTEEYVINLQAGGGGGYAGAQMGMEARRFAGHGWMSGQVTLRLTLEKPGLAGGTVTYSTAVQLRVAPWLMPSHAEEVATVYVADLGADQFQGNYLVGGNFTFRNTLAGEVGAANPAPALVQAVPGNTGDKWIQDVMEIGWSSMPAAGNVVRLESVLEAKGAQTLANFVTGLRAADFGHFTAHGNGNARAFDGHGNLEVTPPVLDSDLLPYHWGRILYGPGAGQDRIDPQFQQFLHAQTVQSPIQIDTSWLTIGHVDELLSFLPLANGEWHSRWFLLVASPRRAYQIAGNADPTARILWNRALLMQINPIYNKQFRAVEQSVDDFLRNWTWIEDPTEFNAGRNGRVSGPVLARWNLHYIQPRIDAIVRQLETAINLHPTADVIEVPVIFFPTADGWLPMSDDPYDLPPHCAAPLTADMVNMLVANDRCIVPRPFGVRWQNADLFEQDLTQSIQGKNNNLQVAFVNDWYPYHCWEGEIHCGTNALRRPPNLVNWGASADARWWEHVP